jgi:methionyl aminopeptidase
VIVCKSPAEIERMRVANLLVADVLAELAGLVVPGVTTADLDQAAERLVRAAGAEPAFKGYRGYPATLCASVNEQVVHGIPGPRALVEGDIISLDMGVKLNGFYGDSAVTVPVGRVTPEIARLLAVTRAALERGIEQVRLGGRVSDIGHAIQEHVEGEGFSVVREFVGHGIGAALHEEPQIANYGEPGRGPCSRRCRTACTRWRSSTSGRSWPTCRADRDGTPSACSSAIASGSSSRRGT